MGRTPHCASFAASACTPARSRQAARLVFPQRPTGVPHLPRRRVRRATQMAGDVPRGEVPGTGEPVQRRAEMRRAAEDALPPLTRSEKMKARWRDPVWRAAMLASRNTAEAARQRSDAARRKWQDPAFRKKMRAARVGTSQRPLRVRSDALSLRRSRCSDWSRSPVSPSRPNGLEPRRVAVRRDAASHEPGEEGREEVRGDKAANVGSKVATPGRVVEAAHQRVQARQDEALLSNAARIPGAQGGM
jgi:hypothetical protein